MGINSLVNVLLQCPNIRYLYLKSLAGLEPPMYLNVRVELPSLETLRVHYHRGHVVHRLLAVWVLPALKTLILDTHALLADLETFWSLAGRTLTRVELGPTSRFRSHDYLGLCLQHCPVLEDLGYYAWATNPPRHRQNHPTLQRIRMHLGQWADVDDESTLDTVLHDHLVEFNHSGMQSLTTFYIHGAEHLAIYTSGFDWRYIEEQIVAEGREIVMYR